LRSVELGVELGLWDGYLRMFRGKQMLAAGTELLEALADKDAELRDKDTALRVRDAELRDKDTELRVRDVELRDKDAALRVRDAELAERNRRIEELQRRLDLLKSDRE
ncbi:MAG: hypothetical protein HYV63_16815, partial [Candidatus Schekmanbacteria bacterium]|nr:hypothetical protein [Candidatus Schekmanbacteria bacterium]